MKERIVGAVVLVIFVVLVVPVFLDGPPAESEIRSERLLLPGQEEQNTKTVVLDRERSVPIPAANRATTQPETPAVSAAVVDADASDDANGENSSDRSEGETEAVASGGSAEGSTAGSESAAPVVAQVTPDEPATTQPAEQPAPAATTAATSSTGMWAVQLGSFSNRENAEKLAADLRKQGYAAFLSSLQRGGSELQRVRIGPQKDRDSAEVMAARLLKVGHKGQVVPHP